MRHNPDMKRTALFAILLLSAAALRAAGHPPGELYKIELRSKAVIWAQDQPKPSGILLIFHRYPDGLFMSLKSADVARVVKSGPKPEKVAGKALKPGQQVVLGQMGSYPAAPAPGVAGAPAAGGPPDPGERKDGTALLNPARAYRPEWDGRQVPGLNVPMPASPGDYAEGKSYAYPPASAVQSAPGQPPMMPEPKPQ